MNAREIQEHLVWIGWPLRVDGQIGGVTRQAIADFQAGWAFWELPVTGDPDQRTQETLSECVRRGGRCAAFFTFREFKSKGNGWIKISRTHAFRLDRLRERVGPISIISGYRDPAHNARVGGASRSEHMRGTATDIPQRWHVNMVRGLHLFTGIGYVGRTGLVAHVDSRPGDPHRPTTWVYR